MLRVSDKLDGRLGLPEHFPVRILENSRELISDVCAFEVLVGVGGNRYGEQIRMFRVPGKLFEPLVEARLSSGADVSLSVRAILLPSSSLRSHPEHVRSCLLCWR